MTFAEYRYLVRADLFRYKGRCDLRTLWHEIWFGESYRFIFWMRTCAYARPHPVLKFLLYPLAKVFWKHLMYRLGLCIPYTCRIGPGFYIGHFGTIVVASRAVLGRNVNISQGVTIGRTNRGRLVGAPTIGDDVYIGPGAKIVGAVTIGSGAAIGANCVVVDDVDPGAVVVGVPGKVISHEGSAGYVDRTEYESVLGPWPPVVSGSGTTGSPRKD